MSYSEQYVSWLQINISHEYYKQGACPVVLSPSEQTRYYLKRFNILFRKQSNNTWILLREESLILSDLLEDEAYFCFELYPESEIFHYVSQAQSLVNDLFYFEKSNKPKIWQTIALNLQNIIEKSLINIELKIDAISKHYEYICIPKYSSENIQIKLIEERNKITLNEGEQIEIHNMVAFRFTSQNMIKLNQQNDYKMQLWEVKNNGEVLISNAIPNPQPNQYSIINPKNSIVSYFYF